MREEARQAIDDFIHYKNRGDQSCNITISSQKNQSTSLFYSINLTVYGINFFETAALSFLISISEPLCIRMIHDI